MLRANGHQVALPLCSAFRVLAIFASVPFWQLVASMTFCQVCPARSIEAIAALRVVFSGLPDAIGQEAPISRCPLLGICPMAGVGARLTCPNDC